MLATMRPSAPQIHSLSRPQSRASDHSNSSAAASASPSRSKADRNNSRAKHHSAGSTSSLGKKNSTQRKSDKNVTAKAALVAAASAVSSQDESKPAKATPGLITLSKPISDNAPPSPILNKKKSTKSNDGSKKGSERSRGNKATTAELGASAVNIKAGRGKRNNGVTTSHLADDKASQLSTSAPASSRAARSRPLPVHDDDVWEMPIGTPPRSRAVAFATGDESSSSPLTWQQQLIAKSSSSAKKQQQQHGSKKAAVSYGHKALEDDLPKEGAQTWQQALFASQHGRGPTFDVFADSRDAATFGDDTTVAPQRRPRAGSVGSKSRGKQANGGFAVDDVFSNTSSGHHGAPATPAKATSFNPASNSSAAFAYAGPNFHNSPSPASLPAPKFGNRAAPRQRVNATAETSFDTQTSSSSSSEDDDADASVVDARKLRSTTAPAEVPVRPSPDGKQAERAATIETLLARMMSP